jgi:hypothetical protein
MARREPDFSEGRPRPCVQLLGRGGAEEWNVEKMIEIERATPADLLAATRRVWMRLGAKQPRGRSALFRPWR